MGPGRREGDPLLSPDLISRGTPMITGSSPWCRGDVGGRGRHSILAVREEDASGISPAGAGLTPRDGGTYGAGVARYWLFWDGD
jgi:hypothetical protein